MSSSHVVSRNLVLVVLSSFVVVGLARAEGVTPEPSHEQTLSPYFFVEGGDPATDRLPLLSTAVTVGVAGTIADVTVRQTYKNDGVRPIHARYVFPASTRAAVHGLTMRIGDQLVTARIREREQARREYGAAKASGRNAALLEQQRPNVFTMDVSNLVPGQRIEVELRYSELLAPSAGVYEFVYPTVVGPRYSTVARADAASTDEWLATPHTHQGEPPRSSFHLDGTVAAGVPVRELTSPSHLIATRGEPTRLAFTLAGDEHEAGNRDVVLRYRLAGDGLQSGLLLYRGEEENFFMTMIQPPRHTAIEHVPPREYVFVVDVSGSMAGFPLQTSKALLRDLIGRLRPTDSFDVVLFSGGSRLWSPVPKAATAENVDDALRMIEQEPGGGGTELLAALRRAMGLPRDPKPRSRSIVVVTDGYIAAEKDVFSFIRAHLGDANVFAFGIGCGVNRHLIEGIAKAGLGEPFVVLDPAQARETAARFRDYVRHPLLTDVHVAFHGFDAYDVEPASIPDVMAERPIVVHGKWRGPARGRVVVSGATGAGPFIQALRVADAESSDAHRALRTLWARERIARLSEGGAGESGEEKRELVSLGLTYDLLTPYTSFIAVHEVVQNASRTGDDVVQPLPLPAGVSDAAIGGVAVGSEPGLAVLLALVLVAWLVLGLRLRASGTPR